MYEVNYRQTLHKLVKIRTENPINFTLIEIRNIILLLCASEKKKAAGHMYKYSSVYILKVFSQRAGEKKSNFVTLKLN